MKLQADNSLFGHVLADVMDEYSITTGALASSANMQKKRVSDAWNGKGDYHLSVYVRIVSALRWFFDDESEYERARERLIKAAFDDTPFRDKWL